jgi:hypothetical protein
MIKPLSFLLINILLCTQSWAIRGGPYDGIHWRGLSALAGTYGVAMRGMTKDPTTREWSTKTLKVEPDADNPDELAYYRTPNPGIDDEVSTTAVLYLTVPVTGICNGKVLLFHKGLMYFGTCTGLVERREMKISLLSELSHYSVLSGAVLNTREGALNYGQDSLTSYGGSIATAGLGVTAAPRTIVDIMLAGQIDLDITLDYYTGLINVDGFANYVEAGTSNNNTDPTRRSVLRDLVIATGSGDTSSSSGQITTTLETMQRNQLIQPANVTVLTDDGDLFIGVKLKATGARQTTDVTPVSNFTPPSAGTSWQIGSPVAGGS